MADEQENIPATPGDDDRTQKTVVRKPSAVPGLKIMPNAPGVAPVLKPAGAPVLKPAGAPVLKPAGAPVLKPAGAPVLKPATPAVAPAQPENDRTQKTVVVHKPAAPVLNLTPTPGTGMGNTKTRKTVLLRPSVAAPGLNLTPAAPAPASAATNQPTPTSSNPTLQITDPMTGRDTDTSNLEVLDDTQTRKTVKLKPIAPPLSSASQPIRIQPKSVVPSSAGTTATRKNVILKPSILPPPGAKSAGTTQTRKTVILKPASGTPPVPIASANGTPTLQVQRPSLKPAVAPVLKPAVVSEDDVTQTRPNATVPDAPSAQPPQLVAEEDITRPNAIVKSEPSAQLPKLTPAAVAPVLKPAVAPVSEDDVTQTRPNATVADAPSAQLPKLTPAAVAPVLKPSVAPVLKPAVAPVLKPAVAPVLKPAVAPVLKPAVAPVSEDDVTQTRPNATIAEAPSASPADINVGGDEADDRTVRIAKPLHPAGVLPSHPNAVEAGKQTVVLPAGGAPVPQGAVDPGKKTITLPAVEDDVKLVGDSEVVPVAESEVSAGGSAMDDVPTEDAANPVSEPASELVSEPAPVENIDVTEPALAPSKLCTLFAVFTVLFLVFGVTLTVISYLNVWSGVRIELPGLPR